MSERLAWTIAYRKPKANRFIRKDLALTWATAVAMAKAWLCAHPDLEVWYVPNRQAEQDGYVAAEDIGNILVDPGKRIRIYEEIPGMEVS